MDAKSSKPPASTSLDSTSPPQQPEIETTPVARREGNQEGEVDMSIPSPRGSVPPEPASYISTSLEGQTGDRDPMSDGENRSIDSPASTPTPVRHSSVPMSTGDAYLHDATNLPSIAPNENDTPAFIPPDTPLEQFAPTPQTIVATTPVAFRHNSEPFRSHDGSRSESPSSTSSRLSPIVAGTSYQELAQKLAPPRTAEGVASSFQRNASAARRTTRGSLAAAAAATAPEPTPPPPPLSETRKPGSIRASVDTWLEPNDPNWTLPHAQMGVSLAQIAPAGATVLTWMRLTRHPIVWDGKTDAGGKSGRNLVLIGYAAGKASVNGKLPAREDDSTSEGLHLLMDCDPERKPTYSYSLITRFAILGSPYKSLSLADIYMILEAKFPWFAKEEMKWRDSIRYNLSSNNWFVKTKRGLHQPGVGNLWTVDEQSIGGPKRPRKGRNKGQWTEADDDDDDEMSAEEINPTSDTRIISANSNGSMVLTFDSKQRGAGDTQQTGRVSSPSSAAPPSPSGETPDIAADRYADARDSTFIRAGMNAFNATKVAKESTPKKTPLPPWMIDDHEQDMEEGIGSGRDDDDDDEYDGQGYGEDEGENGDTSAADESREERMADANKSDEDTIMSEQLRKRSASFSAFTKKIQDQRSGKQPMLGSEVDVFLWDGMRHKKQPSVTIDDEFLRGIGNSSGSSVTTPSYDTLLRGVAPASEPRKAASTSTAPTSTPTPSENRPAQKAPIPTTPWTSHLPPKSLGSNIFKNLDSPEKARPQLHPKPDVKAPNPGVDDESDPSARPTSPWKPAPDSRKRNFASISPTRVSSDARQQKLRRVQNEITERRTRVQNQNPFSASRSAALGPSETALRSSASNRSMPPPPNPTGAVGNFDSTISTSQRQYATTTSGSISNSTGPTLPSSAVFGQSGFLSKVPSANIPFNFGPVKTRKSTTIDFIHEPRNDDISRFRFDRPSVESDEETGHESAPQPRPRRDSTRMETSDDDTRIGRPVGRALGSGPNSSSNIWANASPGPLAGSSLFRQFSNRAATSALSIAVPTSSSRHERGPSSGSSIQSPISPSQQSPSNIISPTLSQSPRLPPISSLLHPQVPPDEHDSLPPIQNIPSRPSSISHLSPTTLDYNRLSMPTSPSAQTASAGNETTLMTRNSSRPSFYHGFLRSRMYQGPIQRGYEAPYRGDSNDLAPRRYHPPDWRD